MSKLTNSISKISVLILGSNGFIGRELVNLFKDDSDNYELTALNRSKLDLMDREAVDNFFENPKNKFDVVINSVSVGGSRLVNDDETIFYQNIITFGNVAKHSDKFKALFYFSSGAYVNNDYYGNSKNVIEKLSENYKNLIILRIYNCFGKLELETRFISSCIRACINKNDITIYQDKYFDFFYVGDFFKVIIKIISNIIENQYFTNNIKIFDLCYEKKYKLSDIANLINKIFENISNIVIKLNNDGLPYCAENRNLIHFLGLDKNIFTLENAIEKLLLNI
jgi:GDP-L-fucose synthase